MWTCYTFTADNSFRIVCGFLDSTRLPVVSPTASSQTPWVDLQTSDSDKIIIENGARFEFAFDLLHDAKFEFAFHVPS